MAVRPVSVVICTRNRVNLLPTVVGYIRAQDYPQDDVEIVIVDNGSTDNTAQVVQRLATKPGFPIRYVVEPRPGVTFARNRGAEEARFPYVAYCDDDCSIGPEWLQHLMSGFDLDQQVVAVGGLILPHWTNGCPTWFPPELETYAGATNFLGNHSRLLEEDERIVEFNMAIERRAWQVTGGFLGMEQFGSRHMAASEGLYLLQQLQHRGGKIAFIPEALMYHHLTGQRTRWWLLQRAYWQGVADVLLAYLLYQQPQPSIIHALNTHLRGFLTHLGHGLLSEVGRNRAKSMVHLAYAAAHLGQLLSKIRWVGDWRRVQSFQMSESPLTTPWHSLIR